MALDCRAALAERENQRVAGELPLAFSLPSPHMLSMTLHYTALPHRHIYRISGADRASFLQGLITNDIRKVDAGEMIFAAMLTPQGKFFADFFIHPSADAYLLDIDEKLAETLIKKLKMYKLRANVEIERLDETVFAIWGDGAAPAQPSLHPDPRFPAMGWRSVATPLPHAEMSEASVEDYNAHRLSHGVPDGAEDATDRSLILDLGYEPLNAVDYQKGCYVGQEVTARMHYKEVKRKGMMKIAAQAGELPEKGEPILAGDVAIGEMASSQGRMGLAMVKFDALEKAQSESTPLKTKTGEAIITSPAWRS